jgi:hypothetical protein
VAQHEANLIRLEESRRNGQFQAIGTANAAQATQAQIAQGNINSYLGREQALSGQNMQGQQAYYAQNAQNTANMMGGLGAAVNGVGNAAQGYLAYQQQQQQNQLLQQQIEENRKINGAK